MTPDNYGYAICPVCQKSWVNLNNSQRGYGFACNEISPTKKSYLELYFYFCEKCLIHIESLLQVSIKKIKRLMSKVLQKHLDADCVIVDPPRKGLHPDIKNVLQELKQGANLVYISCGYESFIRDTKQLLECGYILDFIKGYEFFPGSKEIEILSVFKKI
jgi:hypothetical protein